MAYLAIHGSGAVNGVSRLHGKVSRHLFESLFPRWPTDEVPVGHVTNGIHVPTWDSAAADNLWTQACGKKRWIGTTEILEQKILSIPDIDLWRFPQRLEQSACRVCPAAILPATGRIRGAPPVGRGSEVPAGPRRPDLGFCAPLCHL